MTAIDALLRQLRALDRAQSVIDARSDLAEAFTWRCVADAIRDRRVTLIAQAEAILRSEDVLNREDETPAATEERPITTDLPPRARIH